MLSRAALPLCFRSSGQDRRQAAVEGAGLLHMCGPLAFGAGLGDGGSRRCSCLSAATCSRRRVISPAMAMRSRAMPMPVQRAPAADGRSGFGRGAGTGTGNGSGRGPVGFGLGSGMTPPRRRRSCFAMHGGSPFRMRRRDGGTRHGGSHHIGAGRRVRRRRAAHPGWTSARRATPRTMLAGADAVGAPYASSPRSRSCARMIATNASPSVPASLRRRRGPRRTRQASAVGAPPSRRGSRRGR